MDEKELLQMIERAAEERWTELDLKGTQLTALPPGYWPVGQPTEA